MESSIKIIRKWFKELIKPILELSKLATSQLNCYNCINYDRTQKLNLTTLIRRNPYLEALSDLHTNILKFKALKCSWLRGICNIDINSVDDIWLFIDMYRFYTNNIDIGNLNDIKAFLIKGGIDENQLSFFQEYQTLYSKIDNELLTKLSFLIDKISLSYEPTNKTQKEYIPPITGQGDKRYDGVFTNAEHKKQIEYENFLLKRKEQLQQKEQEEQEEVLGGNKKKIIKKLRKYIS